MIQVRANEWNKYENIWTCKAIVCEKKNICILITVINVSKFRSTKEKEILKQTKIYLNVKFSVRILRSHLYNFFFFNCPLFNKLHSMFLQRFLNSHNFVSHFLDTSFLSGVSISNFCHSKIYFMFI